MADPYRRLLRAPDPIRGPRSPLRRALLVLVLLATLPFEWSEDMSCSGGPQPAVTGLDILTGKGHTDPEPFAVFLAFLLVAVGLGFLSRASRRPWLTLLSDAIAGLSSIGGALMCFAMMTFGRKDQSYTYPAAWIGMLSALALVV